MKRNLVPLLGIAFVVAIAATGIFYGLFVGQLRDASQGAARQQIVVESRSLDRGAVLKAGDLKLSSWAGAPPPGAFQKVDDAAGKTIFVSTQENEPITTARLGEKAAGGIGIQKGMRALSIRVYDSGGLIPFLRAGHHVDVQAQQGKNGPDTRLRTIMQNVEVLSVQQDGSQNPFGASTVTLLATPQDADRLALADYGAQLRLLLRNPLDNEEGTRPGMMLTTLFNDASRTVPQLVQQRTASAPAKPEATKTEEQPVRVELLVRVAGVGSKALEELSAKVDLPRVSRALHVAALRPGSESEAVIKTLEQKQLLEVLSSTRLTAYNNREISTRPGNQWSATPGVLCGLRIQFQPQVGPNRTLRLRVQPEVTTPNSGGGSSSVSSRKVVTELALADGQSFVVSGLSDPGELPSLAERLFGTKVKDAATRELLVVITPQVLAPVQSAAANLVH
jgi:Flp pilus assembly protein CpaB